MKLNSLLKPLFTLFFLCVSLFSFSQTIVTIGEGTATSLCIPFGNNYMHSTTESIYTPEEIGMAGVISSIAYNCAGVQGLDCTVNIYMGHRSSGEFADVSDYVNPSDLQLVYSNSITIGNTAGWVTYELQNSFVYNGIENLVIVVCKSSQGYNGHTYYCTESSMRSLYRWSDGSPSDADINNVSRGFSFANVLADIKINISSVGSLLDVIADYIATIDSFPGLQSELQAAYDSTASAGEDVDVVSVVNDLKGILANVQKAVEVYPIILADIDSANLILAEGAYVDISEALALAMALDVNTSVSSDYFAALKALEDALAIYHADQVDMSDWAFEMNTVCTVDGLRYYLDTTHHLAEFIGFNTSNVQITSLNIPATIRYNDVTYGVVAMLNVGRYTQSNITSVSLPKSLRYIGDYGLGYLSNLSYVEIPENVTLMGNSVFYNSSNLRAIKVNAVVPPTIGSMGGSSYKKITIPAESFHAYRLASGWNENVLIAGDGVMVSTGKIVAGDLGHVVLDEATYLQEVNKLIIDEGTLNNDDWNTIKAMTNLIEIDLSGVTLSSMPASAFDNRWAIEKIVLPQNITSIGNYAFHGTGIKEISLPASLTTLGSYSFCNCDSLVSVTIPDLVSVIPNECFYDCDKLQFVKLPAGLSAINSNAFNGCDQLSSIALPSALTTIGSYAFQYCPIPAIAIPVGVTTIGSYAFAYNTAIENLTIPESVITINSYAFSGCSSLKNVEFNEGLVNIYGRAFQNCSALTEVILPSSLEKCQSAPFERCIGIKKLESRSVIPPSTGGSCPLSNVDLTDVVLYVPSWSTSEYPLASGWSSFYTVEVSDFMPQYIKVNKDFYFTLRETLAADYRPNISMTYSDVESTDAYGYYNYERGNLTISGRSKLAVNDFDVVVSPYAKYYADENVRYGYAYDYYRTKLNSTSLIVNGEMRAENVTMSLCNYNSRWQFVTFPFDVKVSDIVPQSENTSWVIRGHDGAMRAAGRTDSVWVNLNADDVLEAGKGYIMHNYTPEYFEYNGNTYNCSWFNVSPVKESVNRQLIFSSEDRTIELEENLAEFDHNRSWNLIGNPYPCFYDTRFMDFDAPFMVWNSYNQNYVAYNPADDAYILSPGEAFFVQRPYEQESITFRKDGRQNHRYAREMTVNAPARAQSANDSDRVKFNLTLQQDSLVDRTRVVFNDAASLSYEISRDAAKFASTEANVPQIFTLAGKTRYAINERPLSDGEVALGIYCGTDGEFTISIDQTNDYKVILEDRLANELVELTSENGYAFSTKAGENLNRFVLHFQNGTNGISDLHSDSQNEEEAVYNMQGVKVRNADANGIYIKNGKKTVIK